MTGGGGRGVQGSLEVGSMVDVMEIHCIHAWNCQIIIFVSVSIKKIPSPGNENDCTHKHIFSLLHISMLILLESAVSKDKLHRHTHHSHLAPLYSARQPAMTCFETCPTRPRYQVTVFTSREHIGCSWHSFAKAAWPGLCGEGKGSSCLPLCLKWSRDHPKHPQNTYPGWEEGFFNSPW